MGNRGGCFGVKNASIRVALMNGFHAGINHLDNTSDRVVLPSGHFTESRQQCAVESVNHLTFGRFVPRQQTIGFMRENNFSHGRNVSAASYQF
jgi:hypothetical protein